MFNWYITVIRDNYANFSGRARRSEYWYFTLCNILIGIVFLLLETLVHPSFNIVSSIYNLAIFIPSLALSIRRLHDTGKSGWYYLLVFFILIGWIWLIVLFATEGDSGPNEYGEDPKNPYKDDINEIGQAEY